MFIGDQRLCYIGNTLINIFFFILILEDPQFMRFTTFQMKDQANVILSLFFIQHRIYLSKDRLLLHRYLYKGFLLAKVFYLCDRSINRTIICVLLNKCMLIVTYYMHLLLISLIIWLPEVH
jgi:hypothetical protein